MTDRRGRDVQLARREGQAEMPRGGLEGAERVEGRQRSPGVRAHGPTIRDQNSNYIDFIFNPRRWQAQGPRAEFINLQFLYIS